MRFCLRVPLSGLLGIAWLVVSAASSAGTDYEAVAAKFSTTTCALPCAQPRSGEWYLWRNDNRVEIRSGSGQIGEIWRRDDQGRISFLYVEPAHKRGIEYTAIDLRLIGNSRPWERLASIIDPAELEKTGAGRGDRISRPQGAALSRQAGRAQGRGGLDTPAPARGPGDPYLSGSPDHDRTAILPDRAGVGRRPFRSGPGRLSVGRFR